MIIKNKFALNVKPGDITIDGVVLATSLSKVAPVIVTITHRNVAYEQIPADIVQILGRVPADVLAVMIEAVKANNSDLRLHR